MKPNRIGLYSHRFFKSGKYQTVSGKLYIVKIDELYKIGITTGSIRKRFSGYEKKYNISIEYLFEKEFDDIYDAFIIEQHALMNNETVISDHTFPGHTELLYEYPNIESHLEVTN